jgi:hypothetical protein
MRPFNLAKMTTLTVGTGTITLGSAVPGFLTFAQAGVPTGTTVSYGIADGINSEVGVGVYTAAGTTLTRNATRSTNNNTPIPLSGFAHVSIVALAQDVNFEVNTICLFQQTSAPVGWTKSTAYNDRMLRVVSGGTNIGGSVAFSSCFGRQVADAYTLTMNEFAQHHHNSSVFYADESNASYGGLYGGMANPVGFAVTAEGSSYSHAHIADLRVQYVDTILGIKV